MTRTPAEPVSTAAALRDGERRFARRGSWLMALLGLLAAGGPALAHTFGDGQAVLLTAAVFSVVFLGMLVVEQTLGQIEAQAQGLLRLAAWHDSAVGLATPPATTSIRPAPPAPRIRARALAALTLAPRLLPRPIAARAHARV